MIKLQKKLKLKKKPLRIKNDTNDKRREKYNSDETFREKVKERSRNRYRKETEQERLVRGRNLDSLDDEAVEKQVLTSDGKVLNLPVFSVPQASDMMEVRYQNVWRWIKRGQIPEPILHLPYDKTSCAVYHKDEVRVLIKYISKHLKNFAYYREDHTETRDKIYEGIRKVRKRLKLSTKE